MMIVVYNFRFDECLFVVSGCYLQSVGRFGRWAGAVGCTRQSPCGKDGSWSWDWWMNRGMWKKVCPDWLNSLQGWFRKVIAFNHSDQKVIIFGTPTLPFIKAQTSLSYRSLPWLFPFMSILTPPFILKMAILAEEGTKHQALGLQQIKTTPEKHRFSSSIAQWAFVCVTGLILAREHELKKKKNPPSKCFGIWFLPERKPSLKD